MTEGLMMSTTLFLFLLLGFSVYVGMMFWISHKSKVKPPIYFTIKNEYKIGLILMLSSNFTYLVYSLSNKTRLNIGRISVGLIAGAIVIVLYKIVIDWWSDSSNGEEWYEKK